MTCGELWWEKAQGSCCIDGCCVRLLVGMWKSAMRRPMFVAAPYFGMLLARHHAYRNTEAECNSSKPPAVPQQLVELKKQEDDIRARWWKDEEGWRDLPARAWPPVQPHSDAIPGLKNALATECTDSTTNKHIRSKHCDETKFNLATALVFNTWGSRLSLWICKFHKYKYRLAI